MMDHNAEEVPQEEPVLFLSILGNSAGSPSANFSPISNELVIFPTVAHSEIQLLLFSCSNDRRILTPAEARRVVDHCIRHEHLATNYYHTHPDYPLCFTTLSVVSVLEFLLEFGAPANVLEAFCERFPQALKIRTDRGFYPLHVAALRQKCCGLPSALPAFIRGYPDALKEEIDTGCFEMLENPSSLETSTGIALILMSQHTQLADIEAILDTNQLEQTAGDSDHLLELARYGYSQNEDMDILKSLLKTNTIAQANYAGLHRGDKDDIDWPLETVLEENLLPNLTHLHLYIQVEEEAGAHDFKHLMATVASKCPSLQQLRMDYGYGQTDSEHMAASLDHQSQVSAAINKMLSTMGPNLKHLCLNRIGMAGAETSELDKETVRLIGSVLSHNTMESLCVECLLHQEELLEGLKSNNSLHALWLHPCGTDDNVVSTLHCTLGLHSLLEPMITEVMVGNTSLREFSVGLAGFPCEDDDCASDEEKATLAKVRELVEKIRYCAKMNEELDGKKLRFSMGRKFIAEMLPKAFVFPGDSKGKLDRIGLTFDVLLGNPNAWCNAANEGSG